jgi:hypothetical protein
LRPVASREAIWGLKGLKYDQLKEAFDITSNTSVQSKKKLKKTMKMEHNVSEKSVFPYPGLSYDEYVKKMEDSWPRL